MRHQRGFTILEALVVAALSSTLAALSVPQLAQWSAGLQLAGTAQEVATALRLARGHALSEGAAAEVHLDATAGRWELRTTARGLVAARELPRRIGFTGLPARGAVRFGATGTADNATVVLAAGQHVARIIVNQRARVRVE